jgi:hypothetical protein
VEAVGLLAGAGWAAGVNVYAVAALLGILGRVGVDQVPDVLTRTDVLVLTLGLYLVEFVVDKVPWLDSIWDVVHTVVRPAGAAVLGGLLAGEFTDVSEAAAAVGAATIAFASHSVKASARAAINTSPEPVSNGVVSLAEDGLVAGVVLLAVANPVAALVVVVVLLVGGAITVALLVRTIRRAWRGWRRRRRERAAGGTPSGP